MIGEPIWTGTPPDEVAGAATRVDDAFPNIPITVIKAYPVVEDTAFPAGVDWVGLGRDRVPGPSTDFTYLADPETVRAGVTNEQNIVMDPQWFSVYEQVPVSKEDMADLS